MEHREEMDYRKLLREREERLKELACINQTNEILKNGKSVDDVLRQVVMILPPAWQYPEFTTARITYAGKQYVSMDFKETEWVQRQQFRTIDKLSGSIEVFYTQQFPEESEGPFLQEERHLIDNVASLLVGYVNGLKAHEIMHQGKDTAYETELEEDRDQATSRQLLQRFLDRHNAERDVFHDLMPFKVKEILLIANLYDAYSIEGEGRFADHILGEYYQLNLTSMPRVTGVSTEEEAFRRLEQRHYDMIIVVMGVDKQSPVKLCRKVKQEYPYIPTYLLLNNTNDIKYLEEQSLKKGAAWDNYFMWTGESKVFFTMVKLLEDSVNVENDTRIGLTRVILIVEDSSEYYSRYLPMLYSLVMEQTKHLIEDVSADELYKVLKLRARPKILLATDYEAALTLFYKYKENLLCVISDMRFPKDRKLYDKAGFELLQYIKSILPNLPTVLQSSDPANAKYAHALKASFINKNSETLLQDIKSFITYYLGFGHFVYRDNQGRQIAVAKSMKEFESYLRTIPEDSLVYHAMKNHFSLWLMARGEVQLAKIINPMKISDFDSLNELREFLINIIRKRRTELDKGKIVNFEESAIAEESNTVSLGAGSLGGKGRGLAFINTLIYSFDLGKLTPNIYIKAPVTAIIGTDEFDLFLDRNHLHDVIREERDYGRLQKMFIESHLSHNLVKKLRVFLDLIRKPIAVRSSSLFEDSMSQPFSGIFGTYLLPNNHEDFDVRLQQCQEAIKLVFASIYSRNARTYFEAIGHKVEQEKMAVVIQEVVGNRYGDYYYPHISGTAQSHNYYPVAHMKPEEGFAVSALGLGQYVVEGEKAYRYSPAYPKLDIVSPSDLRKNSQQEFYAVDLAKKELDLLEGEDAGLSRLDIYEAEEHKTLTHCVSVYDPENDSLYPGLDKPGQRVVNFANILKYDYIPLANTLQVILDVVKEAFGTPVEIEYAVDLKKDKEGMASFYLLQVKPLVGNESSYKINLKKEDPGRILLHSARSMGNGKLTHLTDIIYIDPDTFDKTRTPEMVVEIEQLNEKMREEGREYMLIGPGRWGTRDRFIGIPVAWPQISNAKVIVEMSLEDFPLDASLGSHFFHNVTSMNVGYFSVSHTNPRDYIRWELLLCQDVVEETRFFKHIRFKEPFVVKMDGRQRLAIVTTDCKPPED